MQDRLTLEPLEFPTVILFADPPLGDAQPARSEGSLAQVRQSSQALIPRVPLTPQNLNPGDTRNVQASGQGAANFFDLVPGNSKLRARARGFARMVQQAARGRTGVGGVHNFGNTLSERGKAQ